MPYPRALFGSIISRFQLDGTGNLLDVGCGTGLLSLPLADEFAAITGMDPDQEMIEEARRHAAEQGVQNIRFITAGGEDIEFGMGKFRLILFGSSLHWMEIDNVLVKSRTVLTPNGGIAICGMPSIWGGESEWEQAVVKTVQRWLGEDRRAGTGSFSEPDRRFNEALSDAGFTNLAEESFEREFELDIPFIIGHLYSTSYCSRAMLGENADEFENDLTRTLTQINPGGEFIWRVPAHCLLAEPAG